MGNLKTDEQFESALGSSQDEAEGIDNV